MLRALTVDERVVDYLRGVNRIGRTARAATSQPLAVADAAADRDGARAGGDGRVGGPRRRDRRARAARRRPVADAQPRRTARRRRDRGRRRGVRATRPAAARCADRAALAALDARQRAEILALLGREALLANVALVVDAAAVGARVGRSRPWSTSSSRRSALRCSSSAPNAGPTQARSLDVVAVRRPTRGEQRSLWQTALARAPELVNGEVDAIVQQFDFGPAAIAEIVAGAARRTGRRRSPGRALWQACREQTGAALDDLARRIDAGYGWDDIVVADDVRAQLRELADQVEQRGRVYEALGLRRPARARPRHHRAVRRPERHRQDDGRRDPRARTSARPLPDRPRRRRQQVHRRDGEEPARACSTRPSAAARSCSSTRPTRCSARAPRSATATTATRTSRSTTCCSAMEDYAGLAILATNRRAALDTAFLRRLRFVIEFPFPGADDRRRIWERVFPPAAALERRRPRRRSRGSSSAAATSGSIAINAAFLAAGGRRARSACRTSMRAAAREYAKLPKPISAAEFGTWVTVARG